MIDKKNIIARIPVNLPSLPLYILLSETITFVVTMTIFFFILLMTGYNFSLYLFFIPIIYFIQQVFAYSLAFFLGIFVVFLRDLKEVVNIGFFIWFWFTPIVYVFDILPEAAQNVLMWNPALAFITAYHDIFVYYRVPSFVYLMVVLILSIFLILGTFFIFRKLEKDIRDFI